MEFEWDEAKSRSNELKHAIAFQDAIRVFDDPLMVLSLDTDQNVEERWRACGQVGGQILVIVVHTYRTYGSQEVIRMISARTATRYERKTYERENS